MLSLIAKELWVTNDGGFPKRAQEVISLLMMNNQKFVTSEDALRTLEGKLLGLVDIAIKEDKARDAMKAAVRQYVWGLERVIMADKDFTSTIERMQVTYMPAEKIKSREELGQDFLD